MTIKPQFAVIGLAVGIGAAVLLYIWKKGSISGAAQGFGSAAVGAVDGVASGIVIGVGEVVGIQPTNLDECDRAISEGRTWDASFACPASKFLKYLAS